MKLHGFGEEADAVHLGHALVGQKKGHRIVASLEFAQGGNGGAAGVRAHDPVAVYRLGRATAGIAVSAWWGDEELLALLQGPKPAITVGLAVQRETFNRIRIANGTPRLADVPPDQDAEEFELHFPSETSLDILTT